MTELIKTVFARMTEVDHRHQAVDLFERSERARFIRPHSGDFNVARHLAIAFPVSFLLGDPRIVHRRLGLS